MGRTWRGVGDAGALPQAPAGGSSPCTPRIGASPQGDQVFMGFSLPWLCVPIWGYAPKPHASPLASNLFILENGAPDKRCFLRSMFFDMIRLRRVCAAALRLSKKHVKHVRSLLLVRSFAFSKRAAPSQAPRVGFWGEAPKGYSEPKQRKPHKHLNPLGRSPNTGVQGT